MHTVLRIRGRTYFQGHQRPSIQRVSIEELLRHLVEQMIVDERLGFASRSHHICGRTTRGRLRIA
jgi:hypothetical protein